MSSPVTNRSCTPPPETSRVTTLSGIHPFALMEGDAGSAVPRIDGLRAQALSDPFAQPSCPGLSALLPWNPLGSDRPFTPPCTFPGTLFRDPCDPEGTLEMGVASLCVTPPPPPSVLKEGLGFQEDVFLGGVAVATPPPPSAAELQVDGKASEDLLCDESASGCLPAAAKGGGASGGTKGLPPEPRTPPRQTGVKMYMHRSPGTPPTPAGMPAAAATPSRDLLPASELHTVASLEDILRKEVRRSLEEPPRRGMEVPSTPDRVGNKPFRACMASMGRKQQHTLVDRPPEFMQQVERAIQEGSVTPNRKGLFLFDSPDSGKKIVVGVHAHDKGASLFPIKGNRFVTLKGEDLRELAFEYIAVLLEKGPDCDYALSDLIRDRVVRDIPVPSQRHPKGPH